MRKFSPTTKHLLLNESNHCMGSTAVHEVQQKLNLFDANVFPLLKDTMIRLDHSENEDGSNSSNGRIPNPRLNENIDSETVIDGSSNDDSNTINVSHSEGNYIFSPCSFFRADTFLQVIAQSKAFL